MDFLKAAMISSKQKLGQTSVNTSSSGIKRKAENEIDATSASSSVAVSEEPSKRFKSRGELESERLAKLAKEKEERIKARRAAANDDTDYDKSKNSKAADAAAAASSSSTAAAAPSVASSASSISAPSELMMINANEVKRRLRSYSEPITLFGETDMERFQRLKQFELVQHEKLTSSHGRKNVFAEILQQDVNREIQEAMERDMEEARNIQLLTDEADAKNEKNAAGTSSTTDAASSSSAAAASTDSTTIGSSPTGDADDEAAQIDETGKIVKSSTSGNKKMDYRGKQLTRDDFATSEEFILYFFKRMLSEWENELDARPKEVRLSERGKMASATQKQTRQFIKPLFKLLKTHTTPSDVLKACEKMCISCLNKEYNLADEAYLTMAIGNAAWPMGVTMVSIHERAGRTKIFSQQVAHVLNDETQRKYIQSVKRLMTYCQEHYPPDYLIPEQKA
jgi:pre-mRNA-splicing factor 18